MKAQSLSSNGKRAGNNVGHIPDSQIDFSDIPELSDEQLAAMRRVDRAPKGSKKSRPQVVSKKPQ